MRRHLTVLAVATAIVVTACGAATPDAEIAVNVPETTTTKPTATTTTVPVSPATAATADELRVDFIAAATGGDMGRVEELLAAAQPDADVIDTLTAMMQQGATLSAGVKDCAQPQGCYVFTDWLLAFLLRMEFDATGNWAITEVSLQSTD